jgi:hypothetical protein
MCISLEHVGFQISPHHQFDDILFDSLLNEMGDPCVPKNMKGDLSLDSGISADDPYLAQHDIMG